MTKPLAGKIAVVAGATRGAGRGIATALGEAGATVYCTDRSTALAVTPGFLRSEWMLDHFGLTEANWRDAARKSKEFIASETPLFVGRGVAALAADPGVAAKNGRVYASWDLGDEYCVKDADGTQPHFHRWLQANMPEVAAGWKKLDDTFSSYWASSPTTRPAEPASCSWLGR